MIKVKKILSLLIISFLILSNIVFAPSHPESEFYEGRPIDQSKEGRDYNREYNKEVPIVVYPHNIGSEEKRMMERFMRGELGEEEMRKMARSKSGKGFSEEEFQRGMIESKRMMERKDAFSYENEGYGNMYYDAGPSYEGYSKEHMIFGMVFEHIGDDIDPREIKQYCDEPEKIADTVINKLKDKVGDLQKVCGRIEEQEAKCSNDSKSDCSRIGMPFVREDATETEKIESVAYSCPPNKDAIIEACKRRSMFHMEQRIKNADEECKKRFDFEGDRLVKECERFRESNICDKDKFVERCMGGIKKEDFRKCNYDDPSKRYAAKSVGDCAVIKYACNSNENYFSNECGCGCQVISQCPTPSAPQCIEDTKLQKKTDANGCIYYYCEKQEHVCPEPVIPTCERGTVEKKADEKGCVTYYCRTIECPQVSKSVCNADETLQTYYDSAGCVSKYECIKHTVTCPEVQKPACGEGQSLTAKYDDKRCVVGYECISVTATSTSDSNSASIATGSAIMITGRAVSSAYDDIARQCENSWAHQQRVCFDTPQICDKDAFIKKCAEMERSNNEDSLSKVSYRCESQTIAEIKHAEQRCARIEKDRQRCVEDSAKRCEHMEGLAQECKELLTEENLRKFIVEETKKRCRFTDMLQDEEDVRKAEKSEVILAVLNTATEDDIKKLELFVENLKEELKLQDTTVYKGIIHPKSFGDIKLMPFVVNAKLSAVASSERAKEVKAKIVARGKVEEAVGKLVSLRDSDVPSQYLYIIEDKASEVLNVSEQLGEIEKKEEQKGIGYKIKLFLGLAKAAEQQEIGQLQGSKIKLSSSIETLANLIDEVPSDVAKAVLKEQVENLKKQQAEIEVLIETKEKKARGLFGVFG